jgi:hypothetical protein
MSELKSYDFEFAFLQYDQKSNILFFRVKQDIDVDLHVITEMLRYAEEVMGPKRHLCVVDFGTSVNSDEEGRKRYANSLYIQNYRIADAFLVNSLALKLVANFFIKITQPKVKTRMFTDEKLAIKWLKKIGQNQFKQN